MGAGPTLTTELDTMPIVEHLLKGGEPMAPPLQPEIMLAGGPGDYNALHYITSHHITYITYSTFHFVSLQRIA